MYFQSNFHLVLSTVVSSEVLFKRNSKFSIYLMNLNVGITRTRKIFLIM